MVEIIRRNKKRKKKVRDRHRRPLIFWTREYIIRLLLKYENLQNLKISDEELK